MDYYSEQCAVKAVVALCALAAQSPLDRIRDDMRDEAVLLVHLWLRYMDQAEKDIQVKIVQQHCERLTRHLHDLSQEDDLSREAVLAAHAAVLRLQLSLFALDAQGRPDLASKSVKKMPLAVPKPVAVPRNLGTNHKKILAFVREHPDVRTKELISHFTPALSDRTVKRYVKDLVNAGVLVRVDEKGTNAISYRVEVS